MEIRTVTRKALDADERVLVATIGASGWADLLLLSRSAKRAGLHLEIDPAQNAMFVDVHMARRFPTVQRKDA